MTDYLHTGKTTTGQYDAKPTFKLVDVIKQKHWQKLSLWSSTFSWKCTRVQVIGCSASCPRLWICSTKPSCLRSRHGSQWLFPNKKSEVPSYLVYRWWIAVEAWFGSQSRKLYFQGINSWEEKFLKVHWCCRRICQKWLYIWYNMLIFYSQVAKLFDHPS